MELLNTVELCMSPLIEDLKVTIEETHDISLGFLVQDVAQRLHSRDPLILWDGLGRLGLIKSKGIVYFNGLFASLPLLVNELLHGPSHKDILDHEVEFLALQHFVFNLSFL